MINMKKLISVALFLPVFCISCKKTSPTISAYIVFASGSVDVIRDGKTSSAKVGETLHLSDIISTGEKSAAMIQISDKIVARIGSESRAVVKSLVDASMELALEKGEIISKVHRLSKGQSYFVKTRTLVASVRGTEFLVRADEKINKVAVRVGAVAIDSESEKVVEQNLIAGKTATVSSDIVVETMTNKDIVIEDISLKDKKKIEMFAKIEPLPEDVIAKPAELDKQKDVFEKTTKELDRIELMSNTELMSEIQREKIQNLLQKETRTIEEIKDVFERIDVVSLYSGKVIQGAIVERGEKYKIITQTGVVDVPKNEVRGVRVIR